DVVGRIFAAERLGKDGSPEAVAALGRSVNSSDMWAVRVAAAKALGVIKTEPARDALVRGLRGDHAKVRRACAAALGGFRDDAKAGAAVSKRLVEGDESWLVEAECARAVGRSRAKGAMDTLLAVYDERDSWNEVVRCGCLGGLAALKDKDAVPTARDATKLGNHNNLRSVGAMALGKLSEADDVNKAAVIDDLLELAEDWWLRTKIVSCNELGRLKEPRALAVLARLESSALDGRVKRTAAEVAKAIREGTNRGDDMKKLRNEVEVLRTELRKLRDEVRRGK
ncbi:MAG: HEAT repeat domain-containing protein, partial [Planctomycetota bacterium]